MGDINVGMSDHSNTYYTYEDVCEFCDIFSLTNLIKQPTCLTPTATHPTLMDVMLTNRPRSFQNSVAVEIGLSDHYKMVITVLKCHFVCLKSIPIQYRNYKTFNPEAVKKNISSADLNSIIHSSVNPNKAYKNFCKCFKEIPEGYAPLRCNVIRGNQAPFMSKELSKVIMTRSRVKSVSQKITENPTNFRGINVFSSIKKQLSLIFTTN